MKTYWDTSALLAAIVADEPHHAAAAAALSRHRDAWTIPHALAECFATLTSGRLELRLSPPDARQVIQASLQPRLKFYPLTLEDYWAAMQQAELVGARGGIFYDLLHLQAARAIQAQRIYTLNLRHFQIFAPDLAARLTLPQAPNA